MRGVGSGSRETRPAISDAQGVGHRERPVRRRPGSRPRAARGRARARTGGCRRTPPRSGRARDAGTTARAGPGTAGGATRGASARARRVPADPRGTAARSRVRRRRLGAGAHGREQPDRLVDQPADGVGEDRGRALVEPLGVVDRDQDRPIRGEESEQPGDRDRQGPLVGRRGRWPRSAAARRRARGAAGAGSRRERLVVDVAEQVGQAAERQPLLGPRRPRGQDEPTRELRRASTAASQTVDFPMPASPSSTSAASPPAARSRNAATAPSSLPRTTISSATRTLPLSGPSARGHMSEPDPTADGTLHQTGEGSSGTQGLRRTT